MNTAQAIDDRLAWVKERAARAQAQAQISTSMPSVIERISSPVISPAAFAPPAPAPSPVIPTETKPRATKEASFLALGQMGLIGLKTSADNVYLVIAAACRNGAADLTRRELQALYEQRFECRMDASSISARVNELVTAQRVFERKDNRVCTVTGNMVGAVYVVMKQVRLVY
jgi:hypothetical protein